MSTAGSGTRRSTSPSRNSHGGMTYSFHSPLIASTKIPSGRGGASVVAAEGKLITFGGTYLDGESFAYLDETWVLDVGKLAWHSVVCSGQIPPARYGHSAKIVGSRMFVFGGKGKNDKVFNDMYFLDLIEWIWVPVSSISARPNPRFNHACELVGRKIVIHGGWNGHECFDDFWIFNTDSFGWMLPKLSGFAPSARFGHTMNLTLDGRLLIFGGCSLDKSGHMPRYNNDVRMLDTDHMVWSRPGIEGTPPTARQGHSTSLVGADKLILFGGWGSGGCQTQDNINDPKAFSVHIFDTATMTWWCPRKVGKKPFRHMYQHGAVSMDDNILLFGGFDGRQAANTFSTIKCDFVFSRDVKEAPASKGE